MKTLVLSSNDIYTLLDLDELRLQMKEALLSLSTSKASNELRHVVDMKAPNVIGFMSAHCKSAQILGYKTVSVFPVNAVLNLNPHQGIVCILCSETGKVKAILDGSAITALRTAAVSALSTEVLSRQNSKVLSIIGSGLQAYEHLRALLKVRNFEKVNIYCRNPCRTQRIQSTFKNQIEIEIHSSVEKALVNSDVLVTCTSSSVPIVDSENFSSGMHINAIGSCRPGQQEINLRFHPKLKIYLDHAASCLKEADEVFRPQSRAPLSLRIVGEIGEVLSKNKFGRQNEEEITFFKSVGLAIEDIYAGSLFYKKAIENKIGTTIQL